MQKTNINLTIQKRLKLLRDRELLQFNTDRGVPLSEFTDNWRQNIICRCTNETDDNLPKLPSCRMPGMINGFIKLMQHPRTSCKKTFPAAVNSTTRLDR